MSHQRKSISIAVAIMLLIAAQNVVAQQNLLDMDISGDSTELGVDSLTITQPSNISNKISLQTVVDKDAKVQHERIAFNSDFQKQSNQRELKFQWGAWLDVADIADFQNWDKKTKEKYQTHIDIEKAWLAVPITENARLKIGRDVIAFGHADLLRQMDVVNPLDLRIPGNTNLDELRLARALVELSHSGENVNITTVVAFEQRFNELPNATSYFALLPVDIRRSNKANFKSSDVIINIRGEALGLEHQLQYAQVRHQLPVVRFNSFGQLLADFNRVEQSSLGSKYIGENIELFAELSHIKPKNPQDTRQSANNYLIGFTYRGLKNAQLQMEYADNKFDDQQQLALLANRRWMNDQLGTTATFVKTKYSDNVQSTVFALSAEYEMSDEKLLQARWVIFQDDENSPTRNLNKKDYLSLTIEKSF